MIAGMARCFLNDSLRGRHNPVSLALIFVLWGAVSACAEDGWVDVSTPLTDRLAQEGAKSEWPGGCSGVVVNRLTGEVTIKVVGHGLWRSVDEGKSWSRVDAGKVGGRDETGWATTQDQQTPGRIASFSLDGPAGWTVDGKTWQSFTSLGRNWDFGSVDWSVPGPKTIVAAKHETDPFGEVHASSDGGVTWRQLDIHLAGKPDRLSMCGALGEKTFIYSKDDGIQRSTDAGVTWTRVSPVNPQTRLPVFFAGAYWLGSDKGLIVSRDFGATWKEQGSPVDVWLGPFFGAAEKDIVVVGKNGAFRTSDAGTTWTKAADLHPNLKGFSFAPRWFGCYAWDPVHDTLYASCMGHPVFRRKLGAK